MADSDPAAIAARLRDQQHAKPLSIVHLAEPILESSTKAAPVSDPNNDHNGFSAISRQSDTSGAPSASELENPTPQSLAADLAHYKDLFSKLRFSYLEQVTKEKYLRSIVGDPPLLVSHADNLALEQKLAVMKAQLKAQKQEVDDLVGDMETLAVELARKYDQVNRDTRVLETAPKEIEEMQAQVDALKSVLAEKRGRLEVGSPDPRMNMGLEATGQALEEQRRRSRELDAEIEALQRQMPGKIRECEKIERELEELERKRNESTKAAREVRRIKEEGGRDVLSEQGRWYRSSEIVMNSLLGVES